MATSQNPPLILASSSARRKEILQGLGIHFRIDPSRITEPSRSARETPEQYAIRLAQIKAAEVRKRQSHGLIVGADTIVVAGRQVLGKPADVSQARSMLQKMSGRWHRVITGLCLTDAASGRRASSLASTRVHFRRLQGSDIDWYLATGEYRDKAGAYAIQGCASLFIDRIEGCYFNVVGFPVSAFETLCRKMGHAVREWM